MSNRCASRPKTDSAGYELCRESRKQASSIISVSRIENESRNEEDTIVNPSTVVSFNSLCLVFCLIATPESAFLLFLFSTLTVRASQMDRSVSYSRCWRFLPVIASMTISFLFFLVWYIIRNTETCVYSLYIINSFQFYSSLLLLLLLYTRGSIDFKSNKSG